MPLTIDQLQKEHQEFLQLNPDRQIDLPTFAKAADELYQTPGERAVGYNWGPIQQFSTGVDRVLSPVSDATKAVGRSVGEKLDTTLGTDGRIAPVLESVAGGLPRVAGEAALTAVAPEGQIPRALAYAAKLAGYGSAAARGYTEHNGSVASAAIEAGTLGLSNAVLPKLDEAAVGWVNKKLYGTLGTELEQAAAAGTDELAKTLAKGTVGDALKATTARTAARIGAGAVGGTGLNELNRQAELTVDGAPLSERNPFTLENVVGNVAGAVGFAPIQIAGAARGFRGADLDRAGVVADWAQKTGRVIGKPEEALASAIDTYSEAKKAGDGVSMNEALKQARASESIRPAESELQFSEKSSSLYNDAVARGVMPSELGDFVKSVNDLIDERNTLVGDKARQDAEFFGREPEPTNTPSAEAVKQLQSKGYLPKITPEWVSETFGKQLERSLNDDPVFAYRAMVNEVANRLVSMTDEAKARMVEDMNKQPTENRPLDRESQAEATYFDALAQIRDLAKSGKIDPSVADTLLKRHISIVNNIGKTREGAEGSGYTSWRELITEAVDNYDLETGNTLITVGSKKGQTTTKEVPLVDLITKQNKEGGYVYNPKFRRFRRAQGGKSTLEMNDVGLSEDSPTPSDIAQAQVYEDYTKGDTQWLDEDARDAKPVEGPKITTEEQVQPTQSPQNVIATKFRETINATQPEALFKNLEPWLRPGRPNAVVERNKKFVKSAINAVIELQGERAYLSKETIDFAKQTMPSFDKIAAKSGEREAVRVATANFWDSTLEKMWKRFRPDEPMPTGKDSIKRYEVLLERVLGKDAIDELKISPAGWGDVETTLTKDKGLAVNKTPSVADRDVAAAYRSFFLNQGYEPALAQHFAEIGTRMVYAYNDVRFKFANLDMTKTPLRGDQAREYMQRTLADMQIAGIYTGSFVDGAHVMNNPLIAVALDHSTGTKDSFISAFMLSVLGHEITHGIERSARGSMIAMSDGPYSAQRVENWHKMAKLSDVLTPLQRYSMLRTLADVVYPHDALYHEGKFRHDLDGFLQTSMKTTPEFIATYAQMLTLGKMTATADNPTNYTRKVSDWLKWQPNEIIDFTQGYYRDLSDHAKALAETIRKPEYRWAEGKDDLPTGGNDEYVAKMFEAVHEAANKMMHVEDIQTSRQAASLVVKNLQWPFNEPAKAKLGTYRSDFTGEGYFFDHPQFMAKAVENENTIVPDAKKVFWQEKQGKRIGVFSYFMPFFQLLDKLQKQGVTLAGDVWNTLSDVQPGYSRVQSRMLDPLLLRTPDGKLKFDNDNPLIKLTTASQRDPKAMLARRALNDILRWQQDNNSAVAVAQNADGSLTPSREARVFLDKRLGSLPREWHQPVIAAVNAMNQVYQQAKGVLWESQVSKTEFRIARLIQAIRPGQPYDLNLTTGRNLTQLALNVIQDRSNPNVEPVAKFLQLAQGVDPVVAEVAGRYLLEGNGVASQLMELKNFLDRRPGFASEQRPGRFLIESVSKDGKREVDGAETASHRDLVIKRLAKQGSKIVEVVDKADAARMTNFDAPDTVYEKAVSAEKANWEGFIRRLEGQLRPDQIQILKDEYVPGETLSKEMATKGIGKFTAERKFVGGRERLDYVDAMRGYVQSLSGSVSRAEARNKMRLILDDARLGKETEFKARALQQLDWVMTPDSEAATKVKTGLAAYYLGGNLSSMLIEGTQAAVTLVPQLLEQGGRGYGLGAAWKTVAGSAAEAWSLGSKDSFSKYVSASDKVKRGAKLTPSEERTYWFRKALDEGILDHGAIEDLYDRDQRALMARKFGHGDYGDTTLTSLVGNKVYQGAQLLMWAYGKMSNFNQKLAFVAGLKQGQELNLSGDKLYEFARKTKDLSMFGGGKANQPGFLAKISNPNTKSTLGVMYTLQQYGLGMTAHLIERGRNAIDGSKTLSPLQKTQARKAFATMATTQVALAGALGLPFVGATLTAIEKLTGVNANAAVREGLASLGGDDQELGALISELALDGSASHFLGLDVGNRVGVSNLLGTSAYRGFAIQDLLGPAPSILTNAVNAVSMASQGNKWEAARQLVPQTFKGLVGLAGSQSQYGDLAFRDKSSNLLYEPTTKEAMLYAIGFRPRELAQKQKLQTLLKTADDSFEARNDRTLDTLARSLRAGDSTPLSKYIETQTAQDPTFDEKSLTSNVINRAVNMEQVVDPLASGPVGNSQQRRKIAKTFDPEIVDRRSEVQRALRADELNAQTGYRAGQPLSSRELFHASMVDTMIQQGLTRSEAIRQLALMRM